MKKFNHGSSDIVCLKKRTNIPYKGKKPFCAKKTMIFLPQFFNSTMR